MPASCSEECHFWRLPLEVRFLVYDLVYGTGKTITPAPNSFMLELDHRSKLSVISRSIDKQSVAARRLVNAQYFSETMQHLAENNIFQVHPGFNRFDIFSPDCLQHVRHLELDLNERWAQSPATIEINQIVPRLRRLQISINSHHMAMFKTSERPDEATIREMPMVVALSEICGLQEFGLHDIDEPHTWPLSRWSAYHIETKHRVGMLRDVLCEMVTRPMRGKGEAT